MISNRYLVPVSSAEFRLTVRGSKFLGWAHPAITEEEAQLLLAQRCRLHHDATHNCWAFRVGDLGSPLERSSDAGEPSGTAGRPILDAIKGAGLVRVIVVVTRWFGGTKLGTGGLIRAYGSCAAETLKLVSTRVEIAMVELTVVCPYDMIGWVERTVKSVGGVVKEGVYLEQATLRLSMPVEAEAVFRKLVDEDGGGRVVVNLPAEAGIRTSL